MSSEEFYYDSITFNSDNQDLIFQKGYFEFVDCQFDSLDMTELVFRNMKFVDCTFSKCNLSNANFSSSTLRSPVFKNSRLLGINWCSCDTFSTPKFTDCQLDYSVFMGLKLSQSIFEGCSLKDVDFSEADLVKSNFYQSSLENASFNKANISQADFRAAKDYNIDPRFTLLKKTKFSMPEAMTLLRSMDIILE
jgi:fluoroquinolone resistance protein